MFKLKQGDIVLVDSTRIGNTNEKDWQVVSIETGDKKNPHMEFFLEEIDETLLAGDYIRLDEINLSARRIFKVKDYGKIKELIDAKLGGWVSSWSFDAKISHVEDAGGFTTQFTDEGTPSESELPF